MTKRFSRRTWCNASFVQSEKYLFSSIYKAPNRLVYTCTEPKLHVFFSDLINLFNDLSAPKLTNCARANVQHLWRTSIFSYRCSHISDYGSDYETAAPQGRPPGADGRSLLRLCTLPTYFVFALSLSCSLLSPSLAFSWAELNLLTHMAPLTPLTSLPPSRSLALDRFLCSFFLLFALCFFILYLFLYFLILAFFSICFSKGNTMENLNLLNINFLFGIYL